MGLQCAKELGCILPRVLQELKTTGCVHVLAPDMGCTVLLATSQTCL